MALSIQNAARSMPRETARAQLLPFHVPAIGDEEIAAVVEVLKSGWLTTGAKVREFEQQFCRFVRSRHAVAVNSASGLESGRRAGTRRSDRADHDLRRHSRGRALSQGKTGSGRL